MTQSHGFRGAWRDVGAVEDVPKQGARILRREGGNIAIFRTASNQIFAVDDRCPHRRGPLSQGIVHGTHVTCPLHNWVIDLISGEATAPDKGATRTFPARIECGRIWLKAIS